MDWLQPLSALVQEPLENTDLDNHSQIGEPLMKFRFPEEKLQVHWSKKNTSLDALEWIR